MKNETEIKRNKGEHGAALLTTLLVAMLLLSAGMALVVSTSLTSTTAIDATAEMQAYSAAEAGLEATLNVLRGHVAPDASLAGTTISFRNAADPATANKTSDTWSTGTDATSRLSGWLNYSYQNQSVANDWRVPLTNAYAPASGLAYKVQVLDPDDMGPIATRKITTDASYQPDRLMIRSEGYGPKGAIKRLEMTLKFSTFDFDPPATILVRSSDDPDEVAPETNIGESNAKEYSGYDFANPTESLPIFAVTHANDYNSLSTEILDAKPDTLTGVDKVTQIANGDLPEFLQTADQARAFLNEMKQIAIDNDRYFDSTPESYGTISDPQMTFCDGNCVLDDGAGLLIVTGTLTGNGNVGFHGVILVLGDGVFDRNGGGSGDTHGAIVVAKFARTWPSTEDDLEHPFLAPTYNMNGGGASKTRFDSDAVRDALGAFGFRTLGVREY